MSQGMIYNIQRLSTKDGPGIRTTVFLKGCPLHCLWCSNPESQKSTPQMLFFENLCASCGVCRLVCPHNAVSQVDGKFGRDLEKCVHCGLCADACPNKARVMSGKMMNVDEVMAVVRQDSLFYENSGGGVTFGGGEPTAGGEFFLDLLQAAYEEAYHVTVDTCGFCPTERFERIVPQVHLFLFDCKHMDPEQHKALTGQDNALILRNMRVALEATEVRIRMPLMPGLNDSDENLAAMAAFFAPYGRKEIEVMPCHAFGRNKYQALGQTFPTVSQYLPEELQAVFQRFEKHGLTPVIV